MVAPVERLVLNIEPRQSGSGTPSPTNVRPISGYNEIDIYRSGADISAAFVYPISLSSAGTVYGGTLNVTTGELSVEWVYYDGSSLVSYTTHDAYTAYRIQNVPKAKTPINFVSSMFAELSPTFISADLTDERIRFNNDTSVIYVSLLTTRPVSDFGFAYELATPITYQLTPKEVTTLLGNNTMWMNANGQMEMTYTGYIN